MNYQFTIPIGQEQITNNIYWRHTSGTLPPGATVFPNGKITVTTALNLISFTKQNILQPGYPRIEETSNESWENYLRSVLSVRTGTDYEFTVQLKDTTGPIYSSHTIRIVYFSPPFTEGFFAVNGAHISINPAATYFLVLTSFADQITWKSSQNLGSIINGRPSQLAIEAVADSGKTLSYQIKPNYYSKLPLGTKLLSNGLLSGRVSFRCSQDDPVNILNDQYEFTARAETANGFSFTEKFFTLTVNRVNLEPSNNIKVRAFPSTPQRLFFDQIINSEDYFPSESIYRLGDPWFGKINYLNFLFVPGIAKQPMQNYENAIEYNHRRRVFLFDTLQTASAVDDNLNTIYEVVYMTPIDDLLGRDPDTLEPKGEPNEIDLRNYVKNLHVINGQTYYILRPDGLENMRSRIKQFLNFSNYRNLPDWMVSVQPIIDKPGFFRSPIGFIPAIVLAYTKPGYSKLIAYRLKDIIFNNFRFEFDRYQLDQYQTENYNYQTMTWTAGTSVTFDNSGTRFDQNGTVFSDGLEYYHRPDTNDKYLKFPIFGVFK